MGDQEDPAWRAVQHARIRLMLEHPYLAAAVARLPLIDATDRPWCPTFATDGYAIYLNLRFASGLAEDGVVLLLAHELVHCVVGHIDRRGDRDPFVWNVAVDYATNALLETHGFRILPDMLLDARFARHSAEAIYDILLTESRSDQFGAARRQVGKRTRGSAKGTTSTSSASAESGGPDEITVRTASGDQHTIARSDAGHQVATDAHLDPSGSLTGESRPRDFPTLAERRRLRRELIQSAEAAAGPHAGCWESELKPAIARPLEWQAALAHFVSGTRLSDYRLFPPHRKHVHRGLYLPSLGVPGPQHLVVAVDTSASMSNGLLARVITQIDHLRSASECALTIMEFDQALQRTMEVEPWETASTASVFGRRVVGRGGTDLRAPFHAIAADRSGKYTCLDALIVITDGWGPSPAVAPHYPVLWVITVGGRNGCRFGAELQMPSGS